MQQFKIVRKFELSFLGDEWKETYINFSALTISDIREKFPAISTLSEGKQVDVAKGMDLLLDVLKSKFLSGKGINSEGKMVDLTVEDLEALPVDVLSKAFGFLSQSTTPPSA